MLITLGVILPQVYAATTVIGAQGLAVTVDETSGAYDIAVPTLNWHFGGWVGYPVSNVQPATGADSVGSYSEIGFDFQSDAPRHATIRAYGNQLAVLFSQTLPQGGPNTYGFPNLMAIPGGLNHMAFSGVFGHAVFDSLPSDSPWAFFDASGNTFIISPADHFMAAGLWWGSAGEIASYISNNIATLPAGFTHASLLVIDSGINRAFVTWGQTLTTLQGKIRRANDAGVVLNQLGYWTDYGAAYYYKTEGSMSYPDTLAAVKADFDSRGIRLGYLQLDSWFYPKGPNADWTDSADGIYQYDAAPLLFESGLSSFAQRIGLPLVTHGRWIDSSSPYRKQYTISGNVATDPAYWAAVAGYLHTSGVVMYEQDWLSAQAQTAFNLADPDAFLGNMAGATAQQSLDVQYCMPAPKHFLQGSKYSNLTNIRVSQDRFNPARWTDFLYASRLAGALGVWPFSDVFMSTETGNLLLATLSAGPVGVGDRIGTLAAANLLHSVRADGVIVKPDVPITPIDAGFIQGAGSLDAPMVAATYSDFGGLRAWYLFAYPQGQNTQATLRLSDLGATEPAYLYDYFNDAGRVVQPSDSLNLPITAGWLYEVAAPLGPSGMAVIGDAGHFVTLGKKRIPSLTDDGAIHLSVAFTSGESQRTIQVYSPTRPRVGAATGTVAGTAYDATRQRFMVTLLPGTTGLAQIEIYRRVPDGSGSESDSGLRP